MVSIIPIVPQGNRIKIEDSRGTGAKSKGGSHELIALVVEHAIEEFAQPDFGFTGDLAEKVAERDEVRKRADVDQLKKTRLNRQT